MQTHTTRLSLLALLMMATPAFAAEPVARVEMDRAGRLAFLSWDTEGGQRVQTNLLRAPCVTTGKTCKVQADAGEITLVIPASDAAGEVTLALDPRVTPTAVLAQEWTDQGEFSPPFVLNAPDFGPMIVTQTSGPRVTGKMVGSRADHWVNLVLSVPRGSEHVKLRLKPLLLPAPQGVDAQMWLKARRGWLNAIQPCARWGEQGRPLSAPAGMLGNNIVSDPASSSLWFYADHIFLMPEPASGVSLLPTLRRTIEYWIDTKMRRDPSGKETGELTCYWDYGNFLDANAGPIIAAWDYVEASNDRVWLERKIDRLEKVADFLVRRDIDGDGLVEATQSGNAGTLREPKRSCAWWDALNCGHKDAYTNAIIYRAFRLIADLESRLKRADRAAAYSQRADRLKAAYFKTLFNGQSGFVAWWKNADGKLHDFASPTTCGLAINYGLVPDDEAKQIVDRLWKKMNEVKFTRLDLGVPPMLLPVPRGDYLLPDAIGCPTRDDGADTFGVYMNGGITAGQVLHFLNANYVTGNRERGDKLLVAMLDRQARGAA